MHGEVSARCGEACGSEVAQGGGGATAFGRAWWNERLEKEESKVEEILVL